MIHVYNFLAMILVIALRFIVMAFLYAWYAVPLGAPVLTMAQLFGLRLLVSVFRGAKKTSKMLPPDELLRETITHGVGYSLVLLIGYIFK